MDEPLILCADCERSPGEAEYLTEINPEGGYGQCRVLVCDTCMSSGRWAHWIAQHWPDWPMPRIRRAPVL